MEQYKVTMLLLKTISRVEQNHSTWLRTITQTVIVFYFFFSPASDDVDFPWVEGARDVFSLIMLLRYSTAIINGFDDAIALKC